MKRLVNYILMKLGIKEGKRENKEGGEEEEEKKQEANEPL